MTTTHPHDLTLFGSETLEHFNEHLRARFWSPSDEKQLTAMIYEFLAVGERRGGSLVASPRNIDTLLKLGFDGALRGDPCLVAEDIYNARIVSYIEWTTPVSVPFDVKYKTLHTWGAFTLNAWRSVGVATKLRKLAMKVAKDRGYECLTGPVHMTNERGMRYFMEEGAWPMSVQFEYLL